MWMRSFVKIYPKLDKKKVWQAWTEINKWPEWHRDLDYCKLDGPFQVGNFFLLKPKNMKKPVKIYLTAVEEGKSFTDCTCFFGAKMYDTHAMEETPEGLKLINFMKVTGPLSWLWVKLVAQDVARSIPEEVEALVERVRKKS